jgi:heat shock protein HtpX
MGLVLIATGAAIGASFRGAPEDATIGALIAFAVFVIMAFVAFYAGDKAILAISAAQEVSHKDFPQLWNVTEEMSIAAGMPMPKLYIIDTGLPNAFATGRNPQQATIAVTRGLMEKLSRDELQGVIAHEMSHIRHSDTTYMTVVVVMLGTIILITDAFRRIAWGTGGRGRRISGKGGGGVIIILLVALLLSILAPLIAKLLYYAISRRREYLADAGAVELTRYPEGLASALEKIASTPGRMESANNATAHLYIVNPLSADESAFSAWTSTHPPTAERIAVLRSVAGSASFASYNLAFQHVTHRSGEYLVKREADSLSDKRVESLRSQATQQTPQTKQAREEERRKQFIGMVTAGAMLTCIHCGAKIDITGKNPDDKLVECAACGQFMPFPGSSAITGLAAAALLTGGVAAVPPQAIRKGPPPAGVPRADGKAILGEVPKPQPDINPPKQPPADEKKSDKPEDG